MSEKTIKALLTILMEKLWEWATGPYQRLKNASHDYGKHYRERHGQLKFSCLEMQEPISLEKVYVTVRLLDQERASQYGSLEIIDKEFRDGTKKDSESNSDERQYGMIVANDKQYLMVLGGPGVGKSTFLRKVGFEALKGKDGNFQHECTPVFLELKRFSENSVDIEALIIHEFKVCGYPYPEQMTKTALKSGKLLVLFDGLDEAPDANVDNIVGKIGDFVDQYGQNRFIASCRKAVNISGFTQFTNVEVADFDDPQIERYINNWFASTSNESTQRLDDKITTADLCWGMLNAREHLATKELVRNPLLLTLLCVVYSKSQNFPLNRADLYKRVLNIFLEGWPSEKYVGKDPSVSQSLDVLDEVLLLSEVAAKNFEDNNLLFGKNELIDQIKEFSERNSITLSTFDARKILEAIAVDQGIFVERLEEVYSFLHLTFQEYLTANYFVRTQSIQKLITEHLHDERWREVFLFAAELMPKADSLLLEMEAEVANVINTDGLKVLFQWAKHIVNPSDNPGNRIAKPTFAVRQFFALWVLNQIHELAKNVVGRYRDDNLDFSLYRNVEFLYNRDLHRSRNQNLCKDLDYHRYLHLALHRSIQLDQDLNFYRNRALHGEYSRDLYQGYDIYQSSYRNLHVNIYLNQTAYIARTTGDVCNHDFYRFLYIHVYLYQDIGSYLHQDLNLDLDLYQDIYRYMNTDCYSRLSSEFCDQFEKELEKRTMFTEYMEQAKIFKGVDLRRMARRFNAQREFIKAAREGKSVEPPEKSIHDTWVSVLHITDDMLAISPQEMQSYIRYLRAMQLIFECKKATRHVPPDIWMKIEDRLLVTDF